MYVCMHVWMRACVHTCICVNVLSESYTTPPVMWGEDCQPRPRVNPNPVYLTLNTTPAQKTPTCLGLNKRLFYFEVSCTNPSSVYAPPRLHCSHGCNTNAILLRNIRPPSDPPLLCHTPYNIVHSNIVQRLRRAPAALPTGGGARVRVNPRSLVMYLCTPPPS